jgi:ribosomal protein L14
MIIEGTYFIHADNSGAKLVKCVKINKSFRKRKLLSSFIKVSLKNYVNKKKLQKHTVYNGMPTLIRNTVYRKDGSTIKSGSNRSLLFSESYKFLGTRCKGLVFRELRKNSMLFKNALKVVKYHTIQI